MLDVFDTILSNSFKDIVADAVATLAAEKVTIEIPSQYKQNKEMSL